MRYAVLSDIHGNYPAFEAVLTDARERSVDGYLLLGDYARDTARQNDVLDRLRNLENVTAILGNGDLGILRARRSDLELNHREQLRLNRWAGTNLSSDNVSYLESLAETAELLVDNGTDDGVYVCLTHSHPLIDGKRDMNPFRSSVYARKRLEDGLDDIEMTELLRAYAIDEIALYPKPRVGIQLFGHNHIQFSLEMNDTIYLNPGSVGYPSDHDTRAAYAILDIDRGRVQVELHRISYELEAVLRDLSVYEEEPGLAIWSELHRSTLSTASVIAESIFFGIVDRIGGGLFPMADEHWAEAVRSFRFDARWTLEDWKQYLMEEGAHE